MIRRKYAVNRFEGRLKDAFLRRDFELIVWMIDNGDVQVDVEATDGETPLSAAASLNRIDVINLLVNRGVNVNYVNRHGRTALMKAAASKIDTLDAVNMLLKQRADVFIKDNNGKTALEWARLLNNIKIARRLELAIQTYIVARRVIHANQEVVEKQNDMTKENAHLCERMTQLLTSYNASAMRDLVATSLVSHDEFKNAFGESSVYFVNIETKQGWTALTKAASLGEVDTINMLISHGANIDQETKLRHNPLTWASYSGHKEAVQLLLQHKANVAYLTREKKSALSHASRNGKAVIVSILLTKYREIFIPSQFQRDYTSGDKQEWHRPFLDNVFAKDIEGKTAVDYAIDGGHDEVVKLLESANSNAEEYQQQIESLRQKTNLVSCVFNCGFENAQDLIAYHQDNKCPRRQIICEKCKETMLGTELEIHEKRSCIYREVACVNLQYGCNLVLPLKTMELHQVEHCHYRLVYCRLECSKSLRWHQRPDHEANECPLRSITCTACNHGMLSQELKKHSRQACSKRLVECKLYGGCGEIHRYEDMNFHTESLCVRRKRPCHWASNGCDAIIGPPEVRHLHEETTCPYRVVACRNGCGMSDILFAFLENHILWDCPKELKECPLGCGEQMESQYLFGHTESNCGSCPNHQSQCPLDLCGKKICFYGNMITPTPWSHRSDIPNENADITRSGVLARMNNVNAFIESGLNQFEPKDSRPYIKKWLEDRMGILYGAYLALKLDQVTFGMVLKYDGNNCYHYISISGECSWMSLNEVYYTLDPATHDNSWVCKPMQAVECTSHVLNICPLQNVSCPNECGQWCQKNRLEHHLSERCMKRMAVCRLGCHKAMLIEALLQHEEIECPKSHQFCPHCHLSCLKEDLDSHIQLKCLRYPRNCRLSCGAQVCKVDSIQHEATECAKRLIECPDCHLKIFACEKEHHLSSDCPFRTYGLCKNGCGTYLLVKDADDHTLNHCPQRMVECLQCKESIICSLFDNHLRFLCTQRKLFCQKGCGVRIKECDLIQHEIQDCIHRLLYCPLKCGLELAMSQLSHHLQIDCPRRLIVCPNHCNSKIPAIEMPAHLRGCDYRMVECGAGGKQCARPLRAWIVDGNLINCYKHKAHGFMWALKCNDIDVVLTFLNRIRQTELDNEFDTGYTPLILACAKGDLNLSRILLEHGADANKESTRGRTPLGEACMGNHANLIALLLEYRAIVSYTNRLGLSTLSIAQQMGENEILCLLEKRQKLENDQKKLFIAIGTSDYNTIEALVAGGEMSYRDSHGWHLAKELKESQEALERVRKLVAEHVDIMNISIADAEAKQMRVIKLLDSLEYNKGQLSHVARKESKLEAVRVHTESTVRDIVRKITAQDIINIISRPNPPDDLVVVLKAMALFQGIIPKPKRVSADSSFSTREWWETAQAMLMDRGFLRRLLDIRELAIEPDVLFKVRRECLKHDAFKLIGVRDLTPPDTLDEVKPIPKQRHDRRNAVTMSTVDALGTWVKGVEMNQKARVEAKLLREKREYILAELKQIEADLKAATFDMKTAHRSLPSRQEELDQIVALEQKALTDFNLKQRRVDVCELLAFTSLNGHTPLSYASGIGNERAIRILLSRGANGGHSDRERYLSAKLLQNAMKLYTQQLKSDQVEIFSIIRYITMQPLYKALKRCRQTQRVPLHEAAYNGHAEVLQLLADTGTAPVWQISYIEPIAAAPGQLNYQQPKNQDFGMNVWRLVMQNYSLTKSLELGKSRRTCIPFHDGRAWDFIHSNYNDAENELESILSSSAKNQEQKRTEQMGRKTVLRRTRHMQELHNKLDRAIQDKDYTTASELLDQGAYPDHATKNGMTILMQAATEDRYMTNIDDQCVLMVEYFLDRKQARPSPNCISTSLDGKFSHTALSIAAHFGSTLSGRILVDRGADVNIQDPIFGQTALIHAVQSNKEDFVIFLLQHRANLHVKDVFGKSAFTYASERRNESMLNLLSAASADMQHNLTIFGKSVEYGLCRWGCGYSAQNSLPVVHNGEGLVISMRNPLREHEEECPKRIVPCPLHCNKLDLWSEEVQIHVNLECPYRLLPCTNPKCDTQIAANILSQHIHNECPHRTVACQLCGESSLAHKFDSHSAICRMRLVNCPSCSMELHAIDTTNHLKHECELRSVRCLLGCGFITFNQRYQHETRECIKHRIECIFSCEEGTTPETQSEHEQICINRLVPCPNHCHENTKACELNDHLKICRLRFVPCSLQCGRQIRAIELNEHISTECSKRQVQCEFCGIQLLFNILDFHITKECPCRIQSCGACGDSGILAKDMTNHKESQCRMRYVECAFVKDGCMKTKLFYYEKANHENFECKYRTIWCPLGCQTHLIARHLKSHEAECVMRFTVCSLGCGAEMREKDRFDHEAFNCIYNKNK
ncbi:hypothetical protein THRCLA_20181 [Thraustotheca clavata]|uniref:TRAF-type domain-containing protein n=1 Tax=Thraustotheca clavata TaxID=74557 RepID=A0A1W0AAT4_9STRA|nr:hypothetical protein THRCLA_20181 [Thraustotheca clavata]